MTERSKEQPEIFDTLLDLLIEQSEEADSLLAGMERAILGVDQYKKPRGGTGYGINYPRDLTVLRWSVIFGDPEATQEMKKVVLDPKANPVNRWQTLEILIESDFPQLKSLLRNVVARSRNARDCSPVDFQSLKTGKWEKSWWIN